MTTLLADRGTFADPTVDFEAAARRPAPAHPSFSGRGIVITAGGPFIPSAYVGVRLLRDFGVGLPIEIWHAGHDEVPEWARSAFEKWHVELKDVMEYCPDRPLAQMRGWPIKPAALMHSSFRELLFFDADCFVLRNPEFLFDTVEFKQHAAVFWPDHRFHKMVAGGSIWGLTGLDWRNDVEFETGIMLLDKEVCWRELCLAEWMNANSSFWYEHVMGDKDTYYLAFRKLGREFGMAPRCRRYTSVLTRHYSTDGMPLADHRTGTSKYKLPTRRGPFLNYLEPYKHRPRFKNAYDELMQRFVVDNFDKHSGYLRELRRVHDEHESAGW